MTSSAARSSRGAASASSTGASTSAATRATCRPSRRARRSTFPATTPRTRARCSRACESCIEKDSGSRRCIVGSRPRGRPLAGARALCPAGSLRRLHGLLQAAAPARPSATGANAGSRREGSESRAHAAAPLVPFVMTLRVTTTRLRQGTAPAPARSPPFRSSSYSTPPGALAEGLGHADAAQADDERARALGRRRLGQRAPVSRRLPRGARAARARGRGRRRRLDGRADAASSFGSAGRDVKLLSFDEPTTVPELRAAGIFAARAPVRRRDRGSLRRTSVLGRRNRRRARAGPLRRRGLDPERAYAPRPGLGRVLLRVQRFHGACGRWRRRLACPG